MSNSRPVDESPSAIARDVEAVGRIGAVPTLLKVLCETTGMGFAAVARVTDSTWTACAVEDAIAFGLKPGGQLDIDTTLCKEVRATRVAVVIDEASSDPVYRDHHTPKQYHIESYISVPIVLPNGEYFGNLCAIDPRPAKVSDPRTVSMFKRFAELIANQLHNDNLRLATQEALRDERQTSELREQFIAILGHDLRNPLAAISGASEQLLHQQDDSALVRDIAARIKINIQRMKALINDTLDLTRGRLGGGIGLQLQRIDDLSAKLEAVARELRDAHPTRNIESRVNLTQPVEGDSGRLQQLASNLLANAITHGACEQPVRFRAFNNEQNLVLEVWNHGPPIPEEYLPKIFAPFWRKSILESREGLGLGLYICSEIVKAHGGTLTVTSKQTEGTRFTTTIPLHRVHAG